MTLNIRGLGIFEQIKGFSENQRNNLIFKRN